MQGPVRYGLLETQQGTLAAEEQHSTRVRERYDRLAPYIALIDHLLLMSLFRIRARAIGCLPISTGDTVIELGCGTGRNFPYLRSAVGDNGRVIGVEFSAGMFARAVGFARQEQLDVELVQQDVARYRAPAANLVLLSLCYHTLEYPMQTLARIWDTLEPGACLAIIDGKQPNFADKLIRPFGEKVLESIFMGDADLKPWENLARLEPVQMKEFVFGAYYVCWAVKS
jgi:demethylmenaquinone methyltransferase/2-methoxy-6-polyprenyl-1,4-benzoquinol methylase